MATTTLHPAAPAYRSRLYEWLTTTDHKKIGILYLVNSLIFFFAGGILALVVRLQLVIPLSDTVMGGLVSADFYNQAFTMHASFMLFLFIIPILAGFGNYAVPLQIGAPDMAFPRINALSFWLLPLGGILMGSGFLASPLRAVLPAVVGALLTTFLLSLPGPFPDFLPSFFAEGLVVCAMDFVSCSDRSYLRHRNVPGGSVPSFPDHHGGRSIAPTSAHPSPPRRRDRVRSISISNAVTRCLQSSIASARGSTMAAGGRSATPASSRCGCRRTKAAPASG